MRTVVPSYARKHLKRCSAIALGCSLLLAAATSDAAPTLTNGLLRVQINVLDPIVVTQSADPGSLTVSNAGSTLSAVQFTGVIASTTSYVVPVSDPGAAPIKGVQATAANGDADFALTGMGGFGGFMPLVGVNKVCLFGACSAAVANLNVPVNVIGAGGAAVVTAAVNLTVVGAPWTTMTAAIGTITRMGGITVMGGGATPTFNVSLVTPVFVSTNIGASAVVPVWGYLDFTIPEPGTVAAFGASIAALVSVGLSRRRKP